MEVSHIGAGTLATLDKDYGKRCKIHAACGLSFCEQEAK